MVMPNLKFKGLIDEAHTLGLVTDKEYVEAVKEVKKDTKINFPKE